MSDETKSYDLTYRQQDVDSTLDNHEVRLRRLEKGALIGAGYALAEGGSLAQHVSTLLF